MLLREFDKIDDSPDGKPWLPCPQDGFYNWCARWGGMWAASLVSRVASWQLYSGGGAEPCGLILAPAVRLFCSYPQDGGSMGQEKLCPTLYGDADGPAGERGATCIPGCNLPGDTCADRQRKSGCFVDGKARLTPSCLPQDCSYPPDELFQSLEAHSFMLQNGLGNHKHNEVVIDLRSVTSGLPNTVEGFFCLGTASLAQWDRVRRARTSFLKNYPFMGDGKGAGRTVVLVELDLERKDGPFRTML